ncbi:hypothetical protein Fcan01_22196 [Folsomia candida]|uniref:Reverse transcriptase domain-containing protein n=1 Tax=Folsomia candida TaxID=158441 RepID=A0A226DEH6_FOLCA|nr:hypothetical protein Fcan01_22196 [Folsomia candida]
MRSNEFSARPGKLIRVSNDDSIKSDETSLLCRGLTFSPTPDKSNLFELHQDHEHFYRRLRLLGHFGPHSGSSSPPSITQFSESIIDKVIPKKSSWTPPPNQFPDLEYFINSSRKALPSSGYSFQSHKSNLSSQELSTIKSLSNRTDIVIRKADKDSDPTSSYQKQVSKTIGNFISSGDLPVFAQRLIEKNPRCSVFYLNPKIHKYGNPGRPIVSTVCCPTSLISAFVDSVLQPLVANTPTYLKDTTHMLQLLENFIFPVDPASCPTFLVTCDVAQLYTVIPHAGGLTAAKVLFESRSVLDPPTHVLIRLLELVLTLNAFEFNSEFFSQISGVAMGTKVGPSYACCFLAHQEFLFFARYSGPMPVLYKRFIDDIFMIFQSPDTDVTIFLDAMSTMHPSLKFETTISSSSICFLDLKISIRDHKILTSIYYKPTDSHSYLPYDSCHPKHVLDSIPYSYDSDASSTKDIVPLVVGYSPNVTTVVQKTKSLFNSILSHNPNFSSKPIVAYRRAPNLQQLLVRSKLKPIGDSILQDSTTFGRFALPTGVWATPSHNFSKFFPSAALKKNKSSKRWQFNLPQPHPAYNLDTNSTKVDASLPYKILSYIFFNASIAIQHFYACSVSFPTAEVVPTIRLKPATPLPLRDAKLQNPPKAITHPPRPLIPSPLATTNCQPNTQYLSTIFTFSLKKCMAKAKAAGAGGAAKAKPAKVKKPKGKAKAKKPKAKVAKKAKSPKAPKPKTTKKAAS